MAGCYINLGIVGLVYGELSATLHKVDELKLSRLVEEGERFFIMKLKRGIGIVRMREKSIRGKDVIKDFCSALFIVDKPKSLC